MKIYRLEPDLVQAGRYFIFEETENYTRTALVVYQDIDLARRITDILNNPLGEIQKSE